MISSNTAVFPLIKETSKQRQGYYIALRDVGEKRGLINFMGSIQKALYGTMDSEDEERYSKEINELKNSNLRT